MEAQAWLFDTDGILTDSGSAQVQAWTTTFAQFFRSPAADALALTDRSPFDPVTDYRRHLAGISRREGIRRFLQARGAGREEGTGFELVAVALAQQKNAEYQRLIASGAVSVFDDVGACIDRLRRSGRLLGVVSASENTRYLLDHLGLASYFDVCVDGLDMAAAHLADRPSPAALLHCSGLLGVEPSHSAVLVSGPDGARAGRSGGYVEVVAVARPGDEPPDHDVAPLVDRVVASLDEVP